MVFPRERFDDAVAADVFFHHRIQAGEAFPDLEKQREGFLGHLLRQDEDDWRDGHQSQHQRKVDCAHDCDGHHEPEDAFQDVVGDPGNKVTDSIGIPGHPGHDIPDPGMVEEVEVQLLQFPVHVLAQHKECVLTDPLEQHLVAVADGRPEERDADHQCQNRHQ